MKATILAFVLFLLSSFPLFAQDSYSIEGAIVDTAAKSSLSNATITLLNSKDSTLYKFTRAREDGSFSINNLKKGRFLLLATYPGYADYVESFSLNSGSRAKHFGKLNMILKTTLLKEVIIKGQVAAIKIKGDTTEFNAASFNIEPNAKVEDLLKQLPGIQVDKDGKITAQGQTVNKVLVDGEEFFGDDPTLVTKNVRSDMVDKVQLYDKKSDQAAFTGIDDGQKIKTLNIKLKEDKKSGYFGKIDAGASSDTYYQGQGMLNVFKAKKKFSAYGTIGNTGKTGLSWQDNSKYGSSNNMEFTDGGGIIIYGGGGDDLESFDGRYNDQGIPLAHTGGLHYDSKWNNDKEAINTNYKIGSLGVEGTRNALTMNNIPTGVIKSNSDQAFDNFIFRHKLDATYTVKLDTSSSLKISVDGTSKNNRTRDNYLAESVRGNNVLLNSSDRSLANDGTQKLFNVSAFWSKKFKKAGRTVSLNISQSLNQNETKGFLNSKSNFYNDQGVLDSVQTIDQYKVNNTKSSVLSSNLTYSEPLSKTLSVILNYGMGINNSNADRRSFNQSTLGKYELLDSIYSNEFNLDQFSNQGGAVFNYKKDKTVINFGTKATGVNFKQINVYNEQVYRRNFLNWYPQVSYQYRFSQQKSFRLSYNGNTSQPNIDQIQPIRINTDPLNVTLGNPNLKPSFTSRVSVNYNSYKVLSNQNIYINGSYSITQNAIVNNTVTNSAGKSTYQAFNMADKKPSNFYLYAHASRKIEKINMNIGLNLDVTGNDYFNLINNEINKTQSYNSSMGLTISGYKAKKYNFYIAMGPRYSTMQASLQKGINNNSWGLNSNGSFSVTLPGKMEISSNGNYEFRGKTQVFDQDLNRFIVNTSISKKFFKQENLKFSLSGNDLLNQNQGFSRNAYNNIVSQNRFTTIQRYFMFSLIWDFNKMGGTTVPKN